jgi:speckle-type POZ protein
LGALLSDGERADVIIKVNGEDIRAHSLILMARSSVFRSMLSSPMREATEGTVIINDLDVAAVKATIAFMYTGQIDEYLLKPDADTLGILEAAHRYDVSSLVDLCVQSLIARLDVSTVSEWLHVADLIGNAGLKTSCLNFMRLHITEVQATDKFAKFVATRPALVTELLASLFPPAKRQRTE